MPLLHALHLRHPLYLATAGAQAHPLRGGVDSGQRPRGGRDERYRRGRGPGRAVPGGSGEGPVCPAELSVVLPFDLWALVSEEGVQGWTWEGLGQWVVWECVSGTGENSGGKDNLAGGNEEGWFNVMMGVSVVTYWTMSSFQRQLAYYRKA